MAVNSGSKDKSLEALDFIINVLKEHEQTLDKSIEELAIVTEQIGDTADGLKGKVEGIEERINNLEKEVTNLMDKVSSPPKEALPTPVKHNAASSSNDICRIAADYSMVGPSWFCVASSGRIFRR